LPNNTFVIMHTLLLENAQSWLAWLVLPGAVFVAALLYVCRQHVSYTLVFSMYILRRESHLLPYMSFSFLCL